MKYVILLYPTKLYIGDLTKQWNEVEVQKTMDLYDRISKERHSKHKRVIVLFGKEGNLSEPDRSQLWPTIKERPTDIVLSCGISFEDHCSRSIYPDPLEILVSLDDPESVVIGGFHMWDCVEKFAKTSYDLGISTIVEEDLTELFFNRSYQKGGIPVELSNSNNYKKRRFNGMSPDLIRSVQEARSEKPWLSQYA